MLAGDALNIRAVSALALPTLTEVIVPAWLLSRSEGRIDDGFTAGDASLCDGGLAARVAACDAHHG
jgi:hypothetical protein